MRRTATTVSALTALLGLFAFSTAFPADAVDFSCMSSEVRGKTPLTARYKEYDIVLRNRCPGPVNWKMCIERLDPVSHEIVDVHTPAGVIEADGTSRVNLQMKKGPDTMVFRKRYQSFYYDVAYSIRGNADPDCIARSCEAGRQALRRQIDENLAAWASAEAALENRLAEECQETGWDRTDEAETCRAEIREAAREDLEALAAADEALRADLQNRGPEQCRLQAGDLVEE